jgi:hypothetical protein
METCDTYQPRHDKQTGKSFLRPDSGKCLHYYFYFIDEELGLIHLRVPTWCPFRLQASAQPIATTSPASAAPLSQPAATSPKTFSFPLWHDKIFAEKVKNRFTRAQETSYDTAM